MDLNGRNFYFVEEKKLGKGRYGNVFLHSLNGVTKESHQFAVKIIGMREKQDLFLKEKLMNSILAESKIWIKFKHRNIVKCHLSYYNRNGETVMNFMEFCNSGNLKDYVKMQKFQYSILEESEIIEIFSNILKGFQYICNFFHERGKNEVFIHRNLKPNNILFHKTAEGKRLIKIGGFSMAKIYISGNNPKASINIHKDYQPPEIAEGEKISDKCDIWSLGVILYYMCYFAYPWFNTDTMIQNYQSQKKLFKGRNLEFDGNHRKISKKMKQIMRKMLRFEEDERISFQELFEHEFFNNALEKDRLKQKKLVRQ